MERDEQLDPSASGFESLARGIVEVVDDLRLGRLLDENGGASSSSGDAVFGYARSWCEVEAVTFRAGFSFKPGDICLQNVGLLERRDVVSSS